MVGLRRNGIDKLLWSAFRFDEGLIRIEATQFFRPKSHSEGDVLVDAELIEIFRGYYARRRGDFVIESDSEPDSGALFSGQYRCQDHIRELIAWLRSKGVVSRTPLHALRKEFGSQINARYGLTAAQEMLRHGDIAVTAATTSRRNGAACLDSDTCSREKGTIVPIDKAAVSELAKQEPCIRSSSCCAID